MAESTAEVSNKDAPTTEPTGSDSVRYLETPEGRRLAYSKVEGSLPGVVYVHGLGSNMHGTKATAIERFCRERGISYVRFELSGHGQSSESFRECTMTTWLEDLQTVMEKVAEGPRVLVGSSVGGWLALLYTMRNPEHVTGLVGIATAADFMERLWKEMDKKTQQQVKKNGVYHLATPYHTPPLEITLDLILDGEKHGILDMPGIEELIKVPTRLFHGEQDTVVPPRISLQLMQKLQCPVEMKTIAEGDHCLSRPEDIELILQALGELVSPPSANVASGNDHGDQIDQELDD